MARAKPARPAVRSLRARPDAGAAGVGQHPLRQLAQGYFPIAVALSSVHLAQPLHAAIKTVVLGELAFELAVFQRVAGGFRALVAAVGAFAPWPRAGGPACLCLFSANSWAWAARSCSAGGCVRGVVGDVPLRRCSSATPSAFPGSSPAAFRESFFAARAFRRPAPASYSLVSRRRARSAALSRASCRLLRQALGRVAALGCKRSSLFCTACSSAVERWRNSSKRLAPQPARRRARAERRQ